MARERKEERRSRQSRRDRVPSPPPPVRPPVAPAPAEEAARHEPRWPALVGPDLPLALCAVNASRLQLGLAVLLVARTCRGRVLCAHFVIDLLACGVTECYGERYDDDDFARYVDDLDRQVELESLTPQCAADLVAASSRRGEAAGVAQPEALCLWTRLLPPPSADAEARVERLLFGPWPRPLAVAELLPGRRWRAEAAHLGDGGEMRCVVRSESPTEH